MAGSAPILIEGLPVTPGTQRPIVHPAGSSSGAGVSLWEGSALLAIGFATIDPQIAEDGIVWTRLLPIAELTDFHVCVCDWYFDDCDPGIGDGVQTALGELERSGLCLSPVTIPQFESATNVFC